MAINYTVSYTFSPSTTISSSQVNTNFSDNANTWAGLEAKTKSFAALQIDAAPTVAADVVRKDYVDKLNSYRRPVIQYGTASTAAIESGLNGTSGNITILFQDGTSRTETSTTHTTFDITRNAVLSGTAQSGLRTGLSEASNTWYALYAVKVTDTSTTWVTVGDTTYPTQANFSTLNSRYGNSGWVFLGYIVNGDGTGGGGSSDIQTFKQVGNRTYYTNASTGNVGTISGLRLATTAGATTLTWTYAAGSSLSSGQLPDTVVGVMIQAAKGARGNDSLIVKDGSGTAIFVQQALNNITGILRLEMGASSGILLASTVGGSDPFDICLVGIVDVVLGIGSNPLL